MYYSKIQKSYINRISNILVCDSPNPSLYVGSPKRQIQTFQVWEERI